MSNRVKAVVRVRPPFKTEVVVPGYSNVVRTVTTSSAQKVIVAYQVSNPPPLFYPSDNLVPSSISHSLSSIHHLYSAIILLPFFMIPKCYDFTISPFLTYKNNKRNGKGEIAFVLLYQ
jgi:hypothetical protein